MRLFRLPSILGPTHGDTRTRLLHCAEQAFLTKGYRGAKLGEIALAAGISKKTIYKFVESKEALFCLVVEEAISESLRPASLVAQSEDLAGALHDFLLPYMNLAFSERGIHAFRMLLSEAFQFPDLARCYFTSVRTAVMAPIEAWLAVQAKAGRLSIANPESAAEMLLAMTVTERAQRLALGLETPPTAEVTKRQLTSAIGIFLLGVMSAPEQSA